MRPAFFVLAGFGRVTLPLPWFPVWLVLLPPALLAWPVGTLGTALGGGPVFGLLGQAPRMWLMSCCLHGLRIRLRDDKSRISLSFV
jgi:hypothetical protein